MNVYELSSTRFYTYLHLILCVSSVVRVRNDWTICAFVYHNTQDQLKKWASSSFVRSFHNLYDSFELLLFIVRFDCYDNWTTEMVLGPAKGEKRKTEFPSQFIVSKCNLYFESTPLLWFYIFQACHLCALFAFLNETNHWFTFWIKFGS